MSGPSDWVIDEDIGGPYGYNIIVVQRDGIRLSCDSPVVPTAAPEMYDALARVQARLIADQPRSLEEAFESTRGGDVPYLRQRRLLETLVRRLSRFGPSR